MNKNQTWRKVLSLLCAMVMLVGIMVVGSVTASAEVADTDVAKIGENGYPTLAKALEVATKGDTIKLLADVNENVTVDKSLTIDGNGFQYVGKLTVAGNAGSTDLVTFNNVKFLADTTVGNSVIVDLERYAEAAFVGCDFTSNSTDTYYNKYKGVAVANDCTVSFKECTASKLYYMVHVTQSSKELTVEDCTLTNMVYGVGAFKCLKATVKNYTFSGISFAVTIRNSASELTLQNANITVSSGEYAFGMFAPDSGNAAQNYKIVLKGDNYFKAGDETRVKMTDENVDTWLTKQTSSNPVNVTAVPHVYETVVTAPTCEEQGYTTHTCKNCGTSYKDNYVDALGHDYEQYTVEADCDQGGGVHETCTICGYDRVISRVPAGHAWNEGVDTAPTFEADGFTTYTCTRENCGATKVETDEGSKLVALVINSTTGKEYVSLTAALKEVANGNTLVLNGNVNENVTISKSITLDGANGVDGRYEYTGTITVNAGLTITIQNVKFVNGGIDKPKAQKSTTGVYKIYDCSFDGEGVYSYPLRFYGANTIDVKGCTVENYLYSFLYVATSAVNVYVYDVTVDGGNSYGVYFASGVTNATFEKFTVKNNPKGFLINNTDNRSFTIKNCKMENVGTAIAHSNGTNAITCTISGNENDFGGAALSAYAKLVLTDATATLKANAGLAVKTNVAGSCVAYNGVYSVFAHAGTAVKENEVPGNCVTDTTYDSVVYCSNCGIEISRTEVVEPATGAHDPKAAVEENRVPAQFDIPGSYDLVVYCNDCGAELSRAPQTIPALVAVASVNGERFTTLQAAIEAANNGNTIVVLKDVDLGGTAVLISGKTITLDLNGKTISGSGSAVIQLAGTMTLLDSSDEKNGAIRSTSDLDTTSCVALSGGTLIVKSGSIISDNAKGIQLGGSNKTNEVTIEGGVIDGADVALNVNRGYNKIYIEGGRLISANHAVNVLNNTEKVSIVEFNITGGEFTGKMPAKNNAVSAGKLVITGGSFSVDVKALCAEGYCTLKSGALYVVGVESFDAGVKTPATFEKNAYTTYTCSYCGEKKVVEHEGTMLVAVATVNGQPYTSLKKAHEAANAGDTIVLVADVVLTENFAVSKNINIDGDGHKLTGTIKISALAVVIENVNFVKGYIDQEANAADYATLKVLNCTFVNGGYAVTTARLDELTIKGCTVTDQSLLYARLSTTNIYVADTTVTRGNYGAYISYADHNIVFENVTMTNMNHFGIMTQNYGAKTVTLKNCSIDAPIPFATQPVKENIRDNFVFVGENKVANIAVNMYNEYCNFKLASGTIDMPNAVVVDSVDANKTAVYNTGKFILVDSVNILNSYLVLGNTIDARFEIENVNSQMTVTVTFAGKTYTLTAEDAAKAGGAYAFNGVIVAKQMTETITVTVTYLDGTVLDTETFTVKKYAEDIISGNYSAAARNLAMALLNYGTAAQNAFGTNTNPPANGGTDYDVYQATKNDGVVNGYDDPDNSYYGASLNLNNGINFNFKFFADMVEGFDYVVVTYLDGKEIVRYAADSEKLGTDFKNLRDLVVVPVDLSGEDANQSLVCTFYKKATVEGEADTKLTYAGDSVLGYCARALEKAPDNGAFSKKFYQTLANYVVAIRYYNENALPEVPEVETEGETENV